MATGYSVRTCGDRTEIEFRRELARQKYEKASDIPEAVMQATRDDWGQPDTRNGLDWPAATDFCKTLLPSPELRQ